MRVRTTSVWGLLSLLFLVGCYDLQLGPDSGSSGDDDDDLAVDDDDLAVDDDDSSEDLDGDGFAAPEDCDDSDPAIHPGATEECNEIDDDCDGETDEEAGQNWFVDQDGDSYGTDSSIQFGCEPPPGGVPVGGDCDDEDPNIHPGSGQQVDGLDSDCDGLRDWLVTFYTAVDDVGELCIDGEENVIGPTGGWVHGISRDIWLPSGTHAVGIQGWDTGEVITAAIAHIEMSDGSFWVSDDTWRYDPNPSAGEESRIGWCEAFFDDSSWDTVLDIGPIGDPTGHWGDAPSLFPDDSPAHWIWDHFPVALNTQYLRKEIVLP